MEIERSSGILVHISSLPSSYGIGDFGSQAYKFIDFLVETRQKIWQILPITPTQSPSPYSGMSAFGGHWWLISPEKLVENNFLSKNDLKMIDLSKFHDDYVAYKDVRNLKEELLGKAYEHFKMNDKEAENKLKDFFEQQRYWIDDFTLFLTIKEQYENGTWADWPDPLRRHQSSALDQIRQEQKDRIQYHLFVQYVFHQQWFELKKYANNQYVKIMGDMPIYIDYDSVDVWAHADLFQLDKENTMKPTVISGFPPDQGADAQIWNMPIYNWNDDNVKPRLFDWWIERLRHALNTVDMLRIDHFRGLESHYVIPVDIKTQKPKMSEARWIKTPGDEFFTTITRTLGKDVPLIIEDIGALTPEVLELRDRFQLHGVRIAQKGFTYDADNMYAPHNFIPRSFAYTGSHDNPTTLQWWTKEASSKEKRQFIDYIRRPIGGQDELIDGLTLEKHVDKHICWYLIQLVMQSASNAAIIQIQDILNVATRMNEPGSSADMDHNGPQNWSWRFQWSQLTSDIRTRLKKLTQMYGRDLKYGKSIPPDDMVMKDSKCLIQ
ncbi:unnamed protein product [Rotaria sordida]|uniref:4-alpha-glucanotransferase n=1 Tax=Rotaria sordida TaxID=392033 RepID=A0A815AA06_9BILA|nr:unnamed protein product [Rotaria sordida]CAF3836533.1 unnamed protein product [Rotaria sordida]